MNEQLNLLVDALKAAGEPTRLRILALLRKGDLAVGELVQILDQSQPRLSHHLKTLANAGLVERLPEGSWVFYRNKTKGWAGRLLESIFAELDFSQGEFAEDLQDLSKVRQARLASAESYFGGIAKDWDRIRALHFPNEAIEDALLDLARPHQYQHVIDLGTGTGRMLTLFAPYAKQAEGLDLSHQMLSVARANLSRAGVNNASVRQGDVTDTPFDNDCADLVIVHQVLHYLEDPAAVLAEAARILKPGGQLLVVDFAPHELEFLRLEHGHHRLGLRQSDMNEWASRAGLKLEPPRQFAPPADLEQGLCVHIWSASRPTINKEAAA